MRFDIFSLFPEVFQPYLEISILKRAIQNNLIEVRAHNIRDWAQDRHHTTDDTPYGGGGGMIMKPEPVFAAVESVLGQPPCCPVILLCPQGQPFTQQTAFELAGYDRLGLICGRYESFDERIREHLATHRRHLHRGFHPDRRRTARADGPGRRRAAETRRFG